MFLLVILAALPLGAQTNPPGGSSNRAGKSKIVGGLILIGAGALWIPATNGGRSRQATWTFGEAMIGAGVRRATRLLDNFDGSIEHDVERELAITLVE